MKRIIFGLNARHDVLHTGARRKQNRTTEEATVRGTRKESSN